MPPSATKDLLTSQATGLAVRRLLDRGLAELRQTLPEAEEQSLTGAAIYAPRKKAIVALTAILADMAAQAVSEG